jgi:hypothetical protein
VDVPCATDGIGDCRGDAGDLPVVGLHPLGHQPLVDADHVAMAGLQLIDHVVHVRLAEGELPGERGRGEEGHGWLEVVDRLLQFGGIALGGPLGEILEDEHLHRRGDGVRLIGKRVPDRDPGPVGDDDDPVRPFDPHADMHRIGGASADRIVGHAASLPVVEASQI